MTLAVILFYSFIAERGWLSLFYDVCFIFLFPVQKLFAVSWSGLTWSVRKIRPKPTGKITNAVIQNLKPKQNTDKLNFGRIGKYLLNPIQRFSVLWCILILFGENPVVHAMAFIALIIAIIAVAKNLVFLFDDSREWEEKIKSDYEDYINEYLSEWNQIKDDAGKKLAKLISFLGVIILIALVANERWVKALTRTMLLALILPYYEYLCALMSFVYFEVAKIQHVNWAWIDALITASFLPATFTSIPTGSRILAFIGGVQSLFVLVVGIGIVVRGAKEKAERLQTVFKGLAESDLTKRVVAQIQPPPKEESAETNEKTLKTDLPVPKAS